MGEKDDTKKEAAEKKPADAGGEKKPDAGPVTVVLKLDLHCDGCAKKIKKSISQFEGVESVRADTAANKLTITGKVDPTRIKERVEFKTKKKVDIISPQPKKEAAGEEKKKENPPEKKPDEKKTDDKKPKETQSSSVVLKIPLHCDGCIHKIKRTISKIDGVESVTTDAGKDLVTVKGTMNAKELVPQLKEKFKRKVDIVPPKKEEKVGDPKDEKKEKKEGGGGEKKEKEGGGGGGGDMKVAGGGDAKAAGGDGAGAGAGAGEEKKKSIEVVNKFEYRGQNMNTYTMPPMYNQNYYNQDYAYGASSSSSNGYVYQGYNHGYDHGYAMGYSNAPQPPPPMYINDPQGYQTEAGMFSDENPNACSLM